MTEVSPAHVETERRAVVDMPALQARILLRDQSFLDPSKTIEAPLLKADTVVQLADRSYGLFEEASLRERNAHFTSTVPFEDKYRQWSEGVSTCFTAETNKAKMEVLRPLLAKIGIINTEVESADIQRLYDRYFDSNLTSSGIKTFVKDVLSTYEVNGKVDMGALARDKGSVLWMAELFGGTSSEMIAQLISSEARLLSDPQCFEELNKTINTVTEPEKRMMGFIYNKEVAEVIQTGGRDQTEQGETRPGTLPIEAKKKDIQDALLNPDIDKVVVSAGTGAGKTTKIPQYIEELLKPGEKVAVTQPRRLPTEELATTVAEQMEVELGQEVGYRHGKGSNVSKDSRIIYTVEGSLLRKLAKDPMLQEYNYVMVDEWHERHKNTDVLVALLQRAQELRRQNGKPQLKMVITSATMDRQDLERQLGERTKSFEVPAQIREFQIEDRFEKPGSAPMSLELMPERAKRAVQELYTTRPGKNMIVFMPGDRLIRKTLEQLTELNLPGVKITTLIGSMSPEEQKAAIEVDDGLRHIIIASPLAETSLTIDKVDVISSGYVNNPRVDENTGFFFLEETEHSKKGLMQQRGRTGRKCDGVFRFLGTEEEYNRRADHHVPELLRSDISEEILLLRSMNLQIQDIPLIDRDKLPQKNVDRAVRRLKDLGALDSQGNITEIGKQMVGIPLDVHFSRMLVESKSKKCTKDIATLAVVCSQTNLNVRVTNGEKDKPREVQRKFEYPNGSDFIARLRMYKAFEEVGAQESDETKRVELQKKWAADHYLRYDTLLAIGEERAELLDRMGYKSTDDEPSGEDVLRRCVFEGFRDNLMNRNGSYIDKKNDNRTVYTYTLRGEPVNNAVVDQYSTVVPKDSPYVISSGNYPRQGGAKNHIYMVLNQQVDPSWL